LNDDTGWRGRKGQQLCRDASGRRNHAVYKSPMGAPVDGGPNSASPIDASTIDARY